MMDPSLIYYACIARGTLVLSEFNSQDAALGAVAAKCLEKTPPLHASFTQTVRSRTYSFLVDAPFVYLGIFDEKMDNSEGFSFLESVRDAFEQFYRGEKRLERLSSHCFQGEFNPVFRRFLGLGFDHMGGVSPPGGRRMSGSGNLQFESPPWQSAETGLSRMKKRFLAGLRIGGRRSEEGTGGESGGKGIGLARDLHKNGGHQKAKAAWRKQVLLILSLDAVICLILFLLWLWICDGLKCICT